MKPILILSLFVFFLSSCGKDKAGSSGDGGPLLTLITDSNFVNGAYSWTDSLVYTYDGNRRLASRVFSSIASPNTVMHDEFFYGRDEKGRTTTVSRKHHYVQDGRAAPDQNSTTTVFYQPGSDQIRFMYYRGYGDNYDYTDSVVYEYTNGQLSTTWVFDTHGSDPAGFVYRNNFTFSKDGNLTACSLYYQWSVNQVDYVFSFDGKTNPLKLGLEEIHELMAYSSRANVVTEHIHSNTSDNTYSSDFTYRKDGRPLSALYKQASSNFVEHVNYFYQ